MRATVELLPRVGSGTSSKLELSAELKDVRDVRFTVEGLSTSSETASGVNTYGVVVTVNPGAGSTPSKMASIKFSCSGSAAAGSGA